MALLSVRAYAKHRGVSHPAVLRALNTGRISSRPDGKIDPAVADAEWDARTDPTRPLNSVTGNPKHRRGADGFSSATLGTGAAGGAGGAGSAIAHVANQYASARAVREAFEAKLSELEFRERSAKLVDADEVRAATFTLARKMRELLLTVPDRVSPILAPIGDALVIHRLLSEELLRVAGEIAKIDLSAPAARARRRSFGSGE